VCAIALQAFVHPLAQLSTLILRVCVCVCVNMISHVFVNACEPLTAWFSSAMEPRSAPLHARLLLAQNYTYTHKHTAHAYTCTHTQACTHARMQAHIHSTRMYGYANIHIHTLNPPYSPPNTAGYRASSTRCPVNRGVSANNF